jgi:integrase
VARSLHRLTARAVATLKSPGRHADGGGLYLSISSNGGRRWVFLWRRNGRPREMGLGSSRDVSLVHAREAARLARQQVREGGDPIETRRQQPALRARDRTFADCAAAYVEAHRVSWKHPKHIAQWENSLATYVTPAIGALPVSIVATADVLRALQPVWNKRPETGRRLRGRIEVILDWARAQALRDGENPARWRGHLKNLLPTHSKVRSVKHRPAMPYASVPGLMTKLAADSGLAAAALRLTILTAARTSETIAARWSEIDRAGKVWTVPGARMKSGRPHRVPLPDVAVKLLERLAALGGKPDQFIFPGRKPGRHTSDGAMLVLLERLGHGNVTVHGFRSSFRDWAAEQTDYPAEIAEAALAHVEGDKTELAYKRTDYFDKRRALMQAWATYCVNQRPANAQQRKRKAHAGN